MITEYHYMADEDLVSLLRTNDEQAYVALYDRFQPLLYSYACRIIGNEDRAEDLTQDVWLGLWDRRSTLELSGPVKNYLYSAVRYRFFNLLERERVRRDYADSLAAFAEQGVVHTDHALREKELAALIESALDRLPPKMRIVFEMSRHEQLSHREIAEKLGITEKTVKNQVHGALKILKKQLGNQWVWVAVLYGVQ